MSRPDLTLPAAISGALRLEGPSGRIVSLDADGSQLRLAVPGWEELRQLGPRSLRSRYRLLATSIRSLRTLRLGLAVEVAGRRAFGVGEGVKPSLLARLLRLGHTDIGLSTVVALLTR